MSSLDKTITRLRELVAKHHGINNKTKLAGLIQNDFELVKDRSVFYTNNFAIRFSYAASSSFSNTVLSLSALQKYDHRLFIVCLVTPSHNHLFIANTTFLKKISHSSQLLSLSNIKGSFNGSDILREFNEIPNTAENLQKLFQIHSAVGFDENLIRLVDANKNISPTGIKFTPSENELNLILGAPARAKKFIDSHEVEILKQELDSKVKQFKNEILIASLIENVNVRGRVIEYLIAGENNQLRDALVQALSQGDIEIPQFKTENDLGDYGKNFSNFITQTDIKTKIMILDSNPKAYNLDKMLSFLATDKSVFMFYFIGLDPGKVIETVLVSMFQSKLLAATFLLKHWAGRNSRGVSQFEGRAVKQLILHPETELNETEASAFLKKIIAL